MKKYKQNIAHLYQKGLLSEEAKNIVLTRLEEQLEQETEQSKNELKSFIEKLSPGDLTFLKVNLLPVP